MVFPPNAVAAALPSPRGLARLTLVALAAAVGFAFVAIYTPPGTGASGPWKGTFVCDAARDWRAKYGVDDQLRVIETYVSFRGTPGQYHVGEGVVVAPVAASLPGAQDVLDVRGDPPPSRRFVEGGVHALGWEYPGTLHRDLAYVGLALVRRPSPKPVAFSEAPTFATLGTPWSGDARLTAADLEEHGLDRCKAFVPWVQDTAGDPPYTAQILRIVERLSAMRRNIAGKRDEDVCAGLRSGSLTIHQVHVAAVMAARQLGAPAVGLTGTDPRALYLLATYVDGPGWIFANVGSFQGHYESPTGAFVTVAPLSSEFRAAQDGFWFASAAAFEGSDMLGLHPVSTTRWVTAMSDEDVTFPESRPLAEVCP